MTHPPTASQPAYLRGLLERAFQVVDDVVGQMNGSPNEAPEPDADDVASDLADALGVNFNPDWPAAAAHAILARIEALEEAVFDAAHVFERLVDLTPMLANAPDAKEMHGAVSAIAGTALDRMTATLSPTIPGVSTGEAGEG